MLKLLPNLTNFGVSPVLRTALSYSPKVGAGIRAVSPFLRNVSANKYMSSVEPFPTTTLSLFMIPK